MEMSAYSSEYLCCNVVIAVKLAIFRNLHGHLTCIV